MKHRRHDERDTSARLRIGSRTAIAVQMIAGTRAAIVPGHASAGPSDSVPANDNGRVDAAMERPISSVPAKDSGRPDATLKGPISSVPANDSGSRMLR